MTTDVWDDIEGLGDPARRAFRAAGLSRLEDLTERTERDLLALHGVGPKAVRLVGERLRSTGLDFRRPT